MGFDPRRWQRPPQGRPITANVDALLAENEALRQEVWALRQQLEQVRGRGASRVSSGSAPGVTAERVKRWCEAMERHPAWGGLRVGPPGGLRGLVEELRRHWWNPSLTLEEELDRQVSGLGAELAAALRGPHSRGRWAVRAAFALYGPRAVEWLSEDPLRVVGELGQRVERLDRRQGRRGTRTANHSQGQGRDPAGAAGGTAGGGRSSGGGPKASTAPPAGEGSVDPRRLQALRLLGLEVGATPQAIKRAYWRLAKAHHPDLGGDPEAFHRLEAAYRLLVD
ncbi:MAG: DnaJ domain-containing protein [Cyanobacteriota bacterium]|nr:DnaJ domain-containing protein [Cyanobacteriota bacterium]